MKLKLITKNSDSFIYLDRYVNGGSRTYSPHSTTNDIDIHFSPTGPYKSFKLPFFEFNLNEVNLFKSDLYKEENYKLVSGKKIFFPVHPEITNDPILKNEYNLQNKIPSFFLDASPSSSTRTIQVKSLNDKDPFLKLHLPKRVSRFVRNLRDYHISQSLKVTNELLNIKDKTFGFLPDIMGASLGQHKGSWGFLLREERAYPYVSEPRFLLPMFSLFSKDIESENDEPILVQIIHHLGVNPAEFTLNKILFPMIKIWATNVLTRGLVFPAHAQNVLLEINQDFAPTRIVYRDLDAHIYKEIRTDKNLHLDFTENRLGHDNPEEQKKFLSLVYDSFIGHHLFDYLAKTLNEHFGVNPEYIQKSCKDFFRQSFPEFTEHFPTSTYYYSDSLYQNNGYELVDTLKGPTWR